MRGRRSHGLAQTLEEHLSQWAERTGTVVEIWALPGDDVPPRVARAVLATLGEALANVERHSRATTVSVAVTLGSSGLRMTVSDDGAGLSGPAAGPGVTAMRAHFAELGGTLTVSGVEGVGTTVTAVAPRRGGRT
ncbi:sensor histidine kinase [Streptosporangium sp. NPDC087985]|uniref:sensor histidine kinase n=1 Tax=Streptosporangium sp. NPDC087985 TaxID=3366196 RepID=UPI003821977A